MKNKNLYVLSFILSIYILSISILSFFDLARNRAYLVDKPYFNSYSYENDLRKYFESVQLLTYDIKNYPLNSEIKMIALNKSMRYYLKNKTTGKVYSNLENPQNLDDYINKEAIHVDEFPRNSSKNNSLQYINSWFQQNNFEGKFIFIKNADGFNQMMENYNYYNSKRSRIVKESIIGIISLLVGIALLIFSKIKSKSKFVTFDKIKNLYWKIPLDLRAFIFMIYSFLMLVYLYKTTFFYLPLSITHFVILTVVSVYTFYLVLNLDMILRFMRDKEEFLKHLRSSSLYQLGYLTKESFKIKDTLLKEFFVFIFTIFFGMSLILALFTVHTRELFLFFFIYIFIFLAFVPTYVLKRIVSLKKIIEGTDAISLGDLDHLIDESGDKNFAQIAKNINSMQGSFKKSVESQLKSERLKTELITNVSHDLKTPLTSIINYISLLKNEGLSPEENKKYINILDTKSQRLKVLIDDLFEASKVSSGAVELNIEKVDIAALLRQTLGELDEKISSSSLAFKVNIPVNPLYLNLDGKRTWRVFENLINNAIKYSMTGSRVYVDLVEQENKVIIILKNISSYEMDFNVDEIFERFKRGDKARNTEGSGLGLSIAKSIVELQGGRMNIEIDGDLFKVTVEFIK